MMFRVVTFLPGELGSTLGEEGGGGCVLPLTKIERSRLHLHKFVTSVNLLHLHLFP